MAAKQTSRPAASKSSPKGSAKPSGKVGKPSATAAPRAGKNAPMGLSSQPVGWLQDASLEVPIPAHGNFAEGQRELEFSVGLRQQEVSENGRMLVRSELRGRALIHAAGMVLALVEASYVSVNPRPEETSDDPQQGLPQYMYSQLRPQLENLLAVAGHTPPLPATLDKVA